MILPSSLTAQSPDDSQEQMTAAFGPQQYTFAAGAVQTFTNTFTHCGTASCQIVVVNGNGKWSDRVSGVTVSLNGVQIIGPKDLNEQKDQIVRPVTLAGTNQLTVTLLSGKPGSFLTITVECGAPRVVLSLGSGGVSVPDQATFLSAFPIIASPQGDGDKDGDDDRRDGHGDDGRKAAALNVQVTELTLIGGALTIPASLPASLGTIPAGSSTVLDADFFGGPFAPGSSYPLTVGGTYQVREHHQDWDKAGGGATYCFELTSNLTVPPAAPGSATASTVTVPPETVSGGGFPHLPLDFSPETNSPRWVVPTALPIVPITPTPTNTIVMAAPTGDPPPIDFVANDGMGLPSGNYFGAAGTTAEPSGGATGGGVIFATANFVAAYSTDGGTSFHHLDPSTVFPHDAIGFCCDQVVQYVPSIDRFIWFLQGGGDNGYRLAVASPATIMSSGGKAWTYYNLLPSIFGATPGTGFDYPDLSVGDNYLYMSWDAGDPCPKGCNHGHQVVRTSLSGLQAGGTIEIDFTDPSTDLNVAWGSHLMQDTGDEIFWAGHYNNKKLRVFSLAEGSNTYYWRDVPIGSWASNSPLSSLTPDAMNWVNFLFNPTSQNKGGGFPSNSVIGATRSYVNLLWFAWSAGTDGNFPQPHIEMVTLDRYNSFRLVQQVQIWDNLITYAYPALATNACTGEIGLSLESGGDSKYFENHVVGFWGDFTVYATTGSNLGHTRYGDYVTIRQMPASDANPGNLFAAFGYGLNTNSQSPGFTSDVHYVAFGRPASSCNAPGTGNIQ